MQTNGETEFSAHCYLVLLETQKYKLLTYNTAKKIQNETAANIPQSKITVSNFHKSGAMFVFKQTTEMKVSCGVRRKRDLHETKKMVMLISKFLANVLYYRPSVCLSVVCEIK